MSLLRLPPKHARALVINCSTKELAALAVASTLRHTPLDVLLVDCESMDGSWDYFRRLQASCGGRLELVQQPLRPHGAALDVLLRDLASETVLLVDSDLEILSPAIYEAMASRLASGEHYGAGLVHAGQWMDRRTHGVANGSTYFMERMWIPLVLLDVGKTRRILEQGASFLATRLYRTRIINRAITEIFASRFRMPLLRDLPCVVAPGPREPENPHVKEFDTGAQLHEQAGRMGYTFADIPTSHWGDVRHLDGATRAVHRGPLRTLLVRSGLLPASVERRLDGAGHEARARLLHAYPGFPAP